MPLTLTEQRRVVWTIQGIGPDPSHTLVIFRKSRAGNIFRKLLEPGKVFRLGWFESPDSYVTYAVSRDHAFRHEFIRNYLALNQLRVFALHFSLVFQVGEVLDLVLGLERDPLRRLEEEIAIVLSNTAKRLPWDDLREGGADFSLRLLGSASTDGAVEGRSNLERLRSFAANLGLRLLHIDVTRSLPDNEYTCMLLDKRERNTAASERITVSSRNKHEVLISHVSPAVVKPGTAFPLEVIFHSSSVEPVSHDSNMRVEEAPADIHVAAGAELLISVNPPNGFNIDESEGIVVWKPPRVRLQFILVAGADLPDGGYWAKVKVKALAGSSIELCRFYIQFQISRCAIGAASPTNTRIAQRLPRTAFASYSRKDISTVMQRVSILSAIGVNVFVDCLDIREGTGWEALLSCSAISKDVFLLFWSRNARASKWVEQEWRHALTERGLGYITPNALEPASVCPPPAELAALQFGGVPLLFSSSNPSTPSTEGTPADSRLQSGGSAHD